MIYLVAPKSKFQPQVGGSPSVGRYSLWLLIIQRVSYIVTITDILPVLVYYNCTPGKSYPYNKLNHAQRLHCVNVVRSQTSYASSALVLCVLPAYRLTA